MNLQTLTNRNAQKGFTIVELLIVIVVIAILAAISIAAYTGIQDRGRNSAAASTAAQVEKKAKSFHAVKGSYPGSIEAFAAEAESRLEGVTVEVTTTAPTASPTDADWTNGKKVIYVPTSPTGTAGAATATGFTIYYKNSSSTTPFAGASTKTN